MNILSDNATFPVLRTSSCMVVRKSSLASLKFARVHSTSLTVSTSSVTSPLDSMPSPDSTRAISGSEPASWLRGMVMEHQTMDDSPGPILAGLAAQLDCQSSLGSSKETSGSQIDVPMFSSFQPMSNGLPTGCAPRPSGVVEDSIVVPSTKTTSWNESTGMAPDIESTVVFQSKNSPSSTRNLTSTRPLAARPLPCIEKDHCTLDPIGIVIWLSPPWIVHPPGRDLSMGVSVTSLLPWLDICTDISCSESAGTPPCVPPDSGVSPRESLGWMTIGIWKVHTSELTLDFTLISAKKVDPAVRRTPGGVIMMPADIEPPLDSVPVEPCLDPWNGPSSSRPTSHPAGE